MEQNQTKEPTEYEERLLQAVKVEILYDLMRLQNPTMPDDEALLKRLREKAATRRAPVPNCTEGCADTKGLPACVGCPLLVEGGANG